MYRFEQRARRYLAGPSRRAPRWSEHKQMFDTAALIVQMFYILSAMFLYRQAREVAQLGSDGAQYDFLWPLAWTGIIPLDLAGDLLASAYVIVGFAGIVFWRVFIVRVATCAVLLHWAAFPSSFGAIHHGHHEWFWISFCFLFLPSGRTAELRANRVLRTKFLYAFGVAPVLILFFYTLSGIYKVQDAFVALSLGQYGGFMPDAMAQTIARRALSTGSEPLWGGLIIDYPILGWPMYMMLYYVEIVAIFIAFRPELLKVWGAILIAFHFGTMAFMDIVFPHHILINGMLFVLSPFALNVSLRDALRAVPLLGLFVSRHNGRTDSEASVAAQ